MIEKEAEYKFCMYQKQSVGSFFTHLIGAMLYADEDNIKLLKKAYPELVNVVVRYQSELDYWPGLVKRWNTQFPDSKFDIIT